MTLTLNQGMEYLRKRMGDSGARRQLAADAERIRDRLPVDQVGELGSQLDLGSGGQRQRSYEAGSILAKRYVTAALPSDDELSADLQRFIKLYQMAIEAKKSLLLAEPGSLGSPSSAAVQSIGDSVSDFKPKSNSDYLAHMEGRVLQKSRRHETLVRAYGEWAIDSGFGASTEVHPRDLVLRRSGIEWLVEAKVIYLGNSTDAVRAALGQLYSYRYFLYDRNQEIRLLGLFSEPIGSAYVNFLAESGVESVWRESGLWVGSEGAEIGHVAEIGA